MLYMHKIRYTPKITNHSSSPKINNSVELPFYPTILKRAALASRYMNNVVLMLNQL